MRFYQQQLHTTAASISMPEQCTSVSSMTTVSPASEDSAARELVSRFHVPKTSPPSVLIGDVPPTGCSFCTDDGDLERILDCDALTPSDT